jgi:hypothetical protein
VGFDGLRIAVSEMSGISGSSLCHGVGCKGLPSFRGMGSAFGANDSRP